VNFAAPNADITGNVWPGSRLAFPRTTWPRMGNPFILSTDMKKNDQGKGLATCEQPVMLIFLKQIGVVENTQALMIQHGL
jgi:hypothetical protein